MSLGEEGRVPRENPCNLHIERPQPDGGIELGTFLLCGNSASHRAKVALCKITFNTVLLAFTLRITVLYTLSGQNVI